MSERDDLLELVGDAYGRLPTMSALVRSWRHLERSERAVEAAREHFVPGKVSYVIGQRNPDGPVEFEGKDRLVIDPRRSAFRVEHEDSWCLRRSWLSIVGGVSAMVFARVVGMAGGGCQR